MAATLISPSGMILHHRARRSTTPVAEAEAKAVRVYSREECRLEEDRTVLRHRNVRAFLRALSETLGCTHDFRQGALAGGEDGAIAPPGLGDPWRITEFSSHPGAGKDGVTTEAGAYRLSIESWFEKSALLGLSDFSPETQDLIAVEILRALGALARIQTGDIWSALLAACARWPGLPCAPGADGRYAPPAPQYLRFCGVYRRYGGTIDEMAGALSFGRRDPLR